MATANRFDLLRDDDSDPPAQAVKVAKSEGARGGGRGYGCRDGGGYDRRDGGGYDRRDGGGYDRDSSRSQKSFGSGGSGGGQAAIGETDSGRTFQRRGGYGGPKTGFRGEHCGFYSINKEGQRDRPPWVFERWRGTGRGNEYKCEGSGRGNWGLQTDELSQVTEKVTIECKKKVDSEKPSVEDGNKKKQGNKQGKSWKSKEKPAQPEQKEREEMTLKEYEKSFEEKIKALEAVKTEERKVEIDKDLAAMQPLSSKKSNDEIFAKLGSDKEKRKKIAEEERAIKQKKAAAEKLVDKSAKPGTKLPSKPLPPAQAVKVAKSEGARGGGRGYGCRDGGGYDRRDGGGYDRRDGGGYDRDSSRSQKSFGSGGSGGGQAAIGETDSGRTFQRRGGYGGPKTGYDSRDGVWYDRDSSRNEKSFVYGGSGGGQAAIRETNFERTFERRGGYGGPQSGFCGEREEGEGDRPHRVFERRSGTGRGNEYKRERSGRGNWGSQTDELSQVTEKITIECKKKVDSEKPSVEDGNKEKQGNMQGKTRKNKEKPAQPEQKEREEMTLKEYEKPFEEKRKALEAVKTEERKVEIDKDLAAMQPLSSKKSNDEIIAKLGSDKEKRKEIAEEERAKKDMSSGHRRLIMQHFAFPEDHIIELDLRSDDPNVYSNFIDEVRYKRCMHVFRILRNGRLRFITNVGTTLGHNVEVGQVGFVVRLISKDESLDVLMERRKIYVVACRRSPDGIWIVLHGTIKKLVKNFLAKSQLASIASGPTGKRVILDPLVIGVGTSYDSMFSHSRTNRANRKVIRINRGRLIEAVRVLCMCSSNKEFVKDEIIAGPVLDIVHSIPEPVRFPQIQKHFSDNYFKDDNSALRLPDHLVAMIYMWKSASRSTFSSLLGFKVKDIQAVTKMCPFIKVNVDDLDEYDLTYAESPPLSPPPPASSPPPPASLSTQSSSTSPFTQPPPIFPWLGPPPTFPWLGPPSTSPCMGSMSTSLCTLPFQVGRPPLSALSTTAPVDQLLPVSHVTSSSAFREFAPQLPPASSLVPYTHLPNFSPALHSGPSPLAFTVDPSFLGQASQFAYRFVNPSPAPVGPATDMPGILSSTYQPQPPQYLSQQYPTTSVHLHTSVVPAPGSSPSSTSPRPQNL